MAELPERELLSKLNTLTKDKTAWPQSIHTVSNLLSHPSVKVRAKALWLLGEMGLRHPAEAATFVPQIAAFLKDENALLRERALNALGRIGRGDYSLAQPYLSQMRLLAADSEPAVRLAFIWACENIAVNTPTSFAKDLLLFSSLFDDKNERVRIEAPEIFRVLGGHIPEAVLPYHESLQTLSETDENKVVRIHAAGAVRAMKKALNKKEGI